MLDIYTKREITSPSDEHILLCALGGRLRSRSLIDQTTNAEFGRTIDASLSRMVQFFRLVFHARSGTGEDPPMLRGLQGDDGERYGLLPKGRPQLGTPRASFEKQQDGKTLIQARARSPQELRNLLARPLAKLGHNVDAVVPLAREHSEAAPKMHVPFRLGPEERRCVAKMACNLFAHKQKDAFLGPGFDAIRNFVLQGQGDGLSLVQISSRPFALQDAAPIGELDHLALVTVDEAGETRGFVALWRHLQFIVALGSAEALRGTAASYRVDQIGGRERTDHEADLSLLDSLKAAPSNADFDTQRRAVNEALSKLVSRTMEQSFDNARRDLVSEALHEVFHDVPEGAVMTQEMLDKLVSIVSQRLGSLLARAGRLDDE